MSRLQAALGGDTRMVLVAGDVGVGKTRFAGKGMRRAAAGGMVSVRGFCLPLAEKLPLLPVAEALGEPSRLGGGGLVEAALGMVPPMCGRRWLVVRLIAGAMRPRRCAAIISS